MSAAQEDIDDSSAPLIEHLAELRNRLIYSAIAFLVAMIICFTVADPIFNFLSHPVCQALAKRGQDCSLVMIKLQEGFFVAIRISFVGGFALAFPVIGYQLWRFIAPGLYRSEKNAFLPFLIASPVMFLLGASFAYYIILPMAFEFFLGFQQGVGSGAAAPADTAGVLTEQGEQLNRAGIIFQGSIEEYLSLTIKFIMAFGLCFQLPVLLTLMGKAGLVSSEGMASVRKYAVVGILVLAAFVTPPDVFSQIILFAVVYGLYEVSILLVRMIEKKRAAAEAAEEAELFGTDPTDPPPSPPAPPAPPAPKGPSPVSPAPVSPAPVTPAPASPAPVGPASSAAPLNGASASAAPLAAAAITAAAANPVEADAAFDETADLPDADFAAGDALHVGLTEEEAFEAGLDEAMFDEMDLDEVDYAEDMTDIAALDGVDEADLSAEVEGDPSDKSKGA